MSDLIALLKAGFVIETWRSEREFVVQVYKSGEAQNYYHRSLRKALRKAAEEHLPKEAT